MEKRKKSTAMIEMERLGFGLHSPPVASTPRYEVRKDKKCISLSESFLDDSIVAEPSTGDKSYLDPHTRLLSRFISDDSGLEQFSIGDDPHREHSGGLTSGRGDVDSADVFSDNSSTDSALGPSVLSLDELSFDEEDQDSSFIGLEQVRSLLSNRTVPDCKSWAQGKSKSLTEEIADADASKPSELACAQHPEESPKLYCEVCEEMCCVQCKKNDHQGHRLTTTNNVRMKRKAKLQTLAYCTREKMDNAKQESAKLTQYRGQLLQQGRYIQDEINSRRDFLHKLVDRWFDKTSFQLETLLQDEQIFVENMIQTLELHINMMDKACDDSEQLISDSTQGERLLHSQESIASLEDLNQNKLPHLDRKLNLILGSGSSVTTDMFGNLAWSLSETDSQPVRAITGGKFIRQFDTRRGHSNRHTCYTASGLSLTKNDRIIVTDIGTDMVQVFDNGGKLKLLLNTYPLQRPTKTVMLHDGTFAVACKNSVKILDTSGEFLRDLTSNLFCPYDVTVNRNGDLVVTDMGERQACIYIYARADLRLLNCIVGGIYAPAFHNAWNVCTDKDDHIIVSDYQEHCVKIFSPLGVMICEFGQKGSGIGQFFHPAGACVDPLGNILVADNANNRVQMFSPQGDFLAVVVSEDLSSPVDLTINSEGHLLVLQGDGQVKVYNYTR